MASIDKNKLISKLGYIAYFNEKVWGQIASTAGNIYHGGTSNITLNNDKITNVKLNSGDTTGKYVANGTSDIVIKAAPKFSSTAYYGSNTTSGSKFTPTPNALPLNNDDGFSNGEPAHLKKLTASEKQYFTLSESDIDAKATSFWTSYGTDVLHLSGSELDAYVNKMKKVITADVIYACCFEIIRKLISIRPFKSTWTHDSSLANKRINEKLNNGNYSYGIFIDSPVINDKWTTAKGTGTWNAGGKLSRWQVTLGGDISKLNLSEASVTRNGVYSQQKATAANTVTMVANFWNAWADRCRAKNVFDYKFFSCHLNCHSSCHSSCHGSRSRR